MFWFRSLISLYMTLYLYYPLSVSCIAKCLLIINNVNNKKNTILQKIECFEYIFSRYIYNRDKILVISHDVIVYHVIFIKIVVQTQSLKFEMPIAEVRTLNTLHIPGPSGP